MLKKKLKVIAGTLLAVVLISQLAIPYSLTPAFAQAKDSILKPVNSPPTNNPNDKKPDKDKPTKDSSKDKLKAEVTQAKPKTEPSDKKLNSDNSPLKIEPLKELKSQDRSSSSDTKKWKHVKMNELPKEVKMDLNARYINIMGEDGKVVSILKGYKIRLSGLKPYSQCILRAKGDGNYPITITANEDGDIYEFLSSSMGKSFGFKGVAFFEGDIIDNSPAEEEMVTFDLVVMSDEKVEGIFIEVYDENDNIIDSGKTNRKGNRLFNLKLPLRKQKLKIKQIAGKSPSGIKYDTEKILEIDPENQRNYSVFFENTRVGRQITVTNQVAEINKPDKPFSYKLVFMNQDEYMWEQPFTLKAGESFTYEQPEPGTRYRLEQISAPPGYTLENIENGRGYTDNQDIHIVAHNKYKATGEFDYEVGKIAIPNEKYSGYFETGLLDEQGHIVISAVNDEKGNFHFNKIKYTEKDVGKHKYKRYIKYTNKGLKLANTIGEIRCSDKSGYPFVDVTVKDNGDGTLSISPINTTNYFNGPFLAPLLPVTGTIKAILAVGVLVLGTTTAIIIKRRKNTKNNHKNGN